MSEEETKKPLGFETEFMAELLPLLAKEPILQKQAPWTDDRPSLDFSDKEWAKYLEKKYTGVVK